MSADELEKKVNATTLLNCTYIALDNMPALLLSPGRTVLDRLDKQASLEDRRAASRISPQVLLDPLAQSLEDNVERRVAGHDEVDERGDRRGTERGKVRRERDDAGMQAGEERLEFGARSRCGGRVGCDRPCKGRWSRS